MKFPMNGKVVTRSEEHTSELQSQSNLVCRLLLEKKKKKRKKAHKYKLQAQSNIVSRSMHDNKNSKNQHSDSYESDQQKYRMRAKKQIYRKQLTITQHR